MTQEVAEKLSQEVSNLKNEIGILRSFVIGTLAKDQEGEYKPEFVKKILGLSKQDVKFTFKNAKSFLAQIQKTS